MATGHILPGFSDLKGGGVVSKYRSRSADPVMTGYRHRVMEYPSPSPKELDAIRQEAAMAWTSELKEWDKKPSVRPTTYSHSFYNKGHVSTESLTKARPTSPTRRNKPHPPNVFLTCHLKDVPGYYDPGSAFGKELNTVEGFQNPDSRVKTEIYRIDGVCHRREQQQRQKLREKYIGRPATTGVLQYREDKAMKELFQDPRAAQAAEAWMKLARRKDREAVRSMIDTASNKGYCIKSSKHNVKVPYQSSIHRYLKAAGAKEAKSASKLFETLDSNPEWRKVPLSGPHFHITDYSSQVKDVPTKIKVKPWKYDYKIHPEFN
ncbi:uncharacterized protein LOC117112247 [Anneissia japonica]|uniref:uncharacterized protein LOC117112247 n=1 Tax=Anneissia japonica TaxID=1529436 RepID=UPI001425877C|nr:uncharacterized protein LOC117112247 [Anneissia japonica]